jgi:hypothetical protein
MNRLYSIIVTIDYKDEKNRLPSWSKVESLIRVIPVFFLSFSLFSLVGVQKNCLVIMTMQKKVHSYK